MELCVNDSTVANPSADDIRRALAERPVGEDFYISLESPEGLLIDAFARADGDFEVSGSDKERDLETRAPIDTAQLQEVLLKALAGDHGWAAAPFWAKAGEVARPAARRSEPPTWAVAIVVGSIAVVVLAYMLLGGSGNSWRDALPFGNSDYFWVGLIGLPMVVLIVVALIVKLREVRKAAAWPMAVGRITRAGTEARRQHHAGDATTTATVPAIEYEFSVGGRTWRGNRISIGEDTGGANTAATLARYPVGAVVTVHYDPANPASSVLERDLPQGFGKGLVALLAIVAIIGAGIWFLVNHGADLLVRFVPGAAGNTGIVLFAGGFGLAVLLFFIAALRTSHRATDWPLVKGTVLLSDVERIEKREDGRTTVTYTPVVEYRYRVNEVDYTSRQIKLGMVLSSSGSYARRVAARYPKGAAIDVHYDPANPSSAALENPTRLYWVLLPVALGCFAIAAGQAGLF